MRLNKLIPIVTLASVPAVAMTSITACSKSDGINANFYDKNKDFLHQKSAKEIKKGKSYTINFDLTQWHGEGTVGLKPWFVCVTADSFKSDVSLDVDKTVVKIGKQKLINKGEIASSAELGKGEFGHTTVYHDSHTWPSIVGYGADLDKVKTLKVTLTPNEKTSEAYFCFALTNA